MNEDTTTGFSETLCGGAVEAGMEYVGGGDVELSVEYDDEPIEVGEYPRTVFKKPTPKGTFLNKVEDGLESKDGVDESDVRSAVNDWLTDFAELSDDQEKEMMTEEIRQIVDGTQSVQVYKGDPTTWNISLSLNGEKHTIEFATGEMTGNSGGPLVDKIMNEFAMMIEVESEDWQDLRDRWVDQQEVVYEQKESADDAVADRVLGFIGRELIPVEEQDRLGNEISIGWFDADNVAEYDGVDFGESILWLQDSFVVNQLNATSKSTEYKGQLVKSLISRGDLHGTTVRRHWASDDGSRDKFWPFDPAALNVTESDVRFTGDADDEVDV